MPESSVENSNHGGITAIIVKGYKAIAEEIKMEIAPLTILAGANSSGKSSVMQPLLLMKQTLQATYDPGALLLNGPHIKFTSAKQLFNKSGDRQVNEFDVGIELDRKDATYYKLICTFSQTDGKLVDVSRIKFGATSLLEATNGQELIFDEKDSKPLLEVAGFIFKQVIIRVLEELTGEKEESIDEKISSSNNTQDNRVSINFIRKRCFLEGSTSIVNLNNKNEVTKIAKEGDPLVFSNTFGRDIQRIIHIPALRGNPERIYQVNAVGEEFPGIFDNYVASIINFWQSGESPNGRENLDRLNYYLNLLQLTTNIEATQLDDTQVEIKVGRLPCAKSNGSPDRPQDMVSIADVGFGVSQTLPVLVALIMADPGQLVYIEQPEIHLHPKATIAIAQAFADAAKRGVKVVVETHSELFLTGVQSLVAEDYLPSELVRLNWFTRRSDGTTKIDSANLDNLGRFGDWPEDFADTALSIQNRYLTAVEQKMWSQQ
jgi:predicted ATPase